jgi:hypothetical protein
MFEINGRQRQNQGDQIRMKGLRMTSKFGAQVPIGRKYFQNINMT